MHQTIAQVVRDRHKLRAELSWINKVTFMIGRGHYKRSAVKEIRNVGAALSRVLSEEAAQQPSKWPLLEDCIPHEESAFSASLQYGDFGRGTLNNANIHTIYPWSLGLGVFKMFQAQGRASADKFGGIRSATRIGQALRHQSNSLTQMALMALHLDKLGNEFIDLTDRTLAICYHRIGDGDLKGALVSCPGHCVTTRLILRVGSV
jgi:hypothetical protein